MQSVPDKNNEFLRDREVIDTISSTKIMNRQREMRQGRIIGVDSARDQNLIDTLAREIPKMYEEAVRR